MPFVETQCFILILQLSLSMEPIGFNYLPPLPDLNQGHPPIIRTLHHFLRVSQVGAHFVSKWIAILCNTLLPHPNPAKSDPPGIMRMLQIGMHIMGNSIPILNNNINNHIIHTH